MATSMERLRDRWEQISPREQRMILVLGITFVVVVLALLGRGISGGLGAIEERNEQVRTALRSLGDYREHLAKGGGTPGEINLPDEPVKLQSYLEGVATEVGITIPGFKPQTGSARDGVATAATRIEVNGLSLSQLTAFLERVESKSPYVMVEQLDIKRDFRNKEQLSASMLVVAYANQKKDAAAEEGDGEGDE
ncbi:type II secretion system protein GspM [Haliangium ochraceum]|uniref:General secretion pathway protein M n=1 Tax=Haliangium ochraceum (strain DSM 14365 / JCM 11303 / SMP-2) TaxID=502025 RepID=D0LLX2_HALO1|nr:type II secretion system protein GspM [Haliangium ochraceum]ACY15150.1 hypothetical protein Hoch_2617 [Haliangium ochraceum DSM 14365]